MRAVIIVGLLAATASAEPRVTWGDWVGAYEGKLAWHGCTTDGANQAALALAATDGVMAIDLAPASAGLRAMTLVEDERGFSGQQGDVKVAITRPRANAIAVVVELDSGCTMKAQLARASTKVAACDQLLAWARVEAACTKTAGRLEDVARLAATRWKPADAQRCSARAARLEHAMVDAGCAPHPDPLIGVRARDCLELSQAAAKLARCNALPADLMDALKAELQALAASAQTAEKATLPYVERQCRDARSKVAAVAAKFQCPL